MNKKSWQVIPHAGDILLWGILLMQILANNNMCIVMNEDTTII